MDPAPADSDEDDEDEKFLLWQTFKAHQKRMREAGQNRDEDQEQYDDQEENQERGKKEEPSFLQWEGEEPDLVPDVYTEAVEPSELQLDTWYADPRTRSFSTWFEGHRVWVKRQATSTRVEIKRGYENCTKSCWCWVPETPSEIGFWHKLEDRVPIETVLNCFVRKGSEEGLPTDVIVLIHREELDIPIQNPQGTGRRARKRAKREAEAAAKESEMQVEPDDADDKAEDKKSTKDEESDKS